MEAHYNYQKEYSGKRIYNNVDVNRVYDILFEINSTSKGTWKINGSRAGFGLGAVQWISSALICEMLNNARVALTTGL